MEVCGSHTASDYTKVQSQKYTTNLIVIPGDTEAAAELSASKLDTNAPSNSLSPQLVVKFLSSTDRYDAPINHGVMSLWEIILGMYSGDIKPIPSGNFKIGKILSGCKKIVNQNKNVEYLQNILEKFKNKLNQNYKTIICCTNTDFITDYLEGTGGKRVSLVSYPPEINFMAKIEEDYYIYDINKLLPKIILTDPEATIEEFPNALVKGKKLIIKISKNLDNIKVNLIDDENKDGNSEFVILETKKIGDSFIDNGYLNFKITFIAKCEDYSIDLQGIEFAFKNVLKIDFYNNDGIENSIIKFKLPCIENYGINGRSVSEYNICERVGNEYEIKGNKCYDYIYFDSQSNKNVIEICVPNSSVIKYYNPEDMKIAASRLREYYVYNSVCPDLLKVKYPTTNDFGGVDSHGTDISGASLLFKCDGAVGSVLDGSDDYITGIAANWDSNITDRIKFRCKSGKESEWSPGDWGDWYSQGWPINFPYGINKITFSKLNNDPYYWRGLNSNGYDNFSRNNLSTSAVIGGGWGDLSPDSKTVTCPDGMILKEVGVANQLGSIAGFAGKCVAIKPCSEDGGICCDKST